MVGEARASYRSRPRAAAMVAVVIDDVGARRRVEAVLARAGLQIGAAEEDALSLSATLGGRSPSVVVVAPGERSSVTAAIRSVRRRLGGVPIVALSPAGDEVECRRAISAGADGAVRDRDLDAALAATVTAAAAGQISFPDGLQGAADERSLTPREKQVLRCVVTGLTNAQIARELGLAESTVKSHLSSAFAKLGVASRAEAAALIRDQVRAPGLDPAPGGSEGEPGATW
jgi:DNA-binding NarL/FixJ family response regulator